MASENNEYPDLVIVGAGLFARQMKTVGNMTRNALLSWQALLERAVRAIINGSTLTDRERMVLHRVNTRHAWWANDLSLPWVENGDGGLRPCTMRTRNMLLLPVPAYLLKLSRRIVTHAITRTPIPDLSHVRTLVLDAIIAKPERPHAHTDTRFGWWIRVATLTKGKPVLIPVDRNEYFEQQYAHAIKHGGGLCGVIQLTRHDNGTLSCALVLDRPDAPMRMDGKPLGIDYGMADALMADSDGNLMGHAMLATLKRYDLRLTQLGAWLQRRHIKPSTNHEYRRLQHRIRAYVANEIGRILNRVAARHGAAKVRELIVERLDFRYGGMSPRMNRLITRIGRVVCGAGCSCQTRFRLDDAKFQGVRFGFVAWMPLLQMQRPAPSVVGEANGDAADHEQPDHGDRHPDPQPCVVLGRVLWQWGLFGHVRADPGDEEAFVVHAVRGAGQ